MVTVVDQNKLAANTTLLACLAPIRNMLLTAGYILPFLSGKGLGIAEIMTLQALFMVGGVFMEVPSGFLADRFGRVRMIRLGAVCLGAGCTAFVWAGSFQELILCEMLMAAGYALISGADDALLFDSLKAIGREGDYTELSNRTDKWYFKAHIIVVPVSVVLASSFGFTVLVIADAALAFGLALVLGRLVEAPSADTAGPGKPDAHRRKRITWSAVLQSVRRLGSSAEVCWLTILGVIMAVQSHLGFWLMQAYAQSSGWPAWSYGLLIGAAHTVSFATLYCPRASDPSRLKSTLLWCVLLIAAGYAACASGQLWLLLAAFGVNAANVLQNRLVRAKLHEHMPSDQRATLMSGVQVVQRLAFAIGGLAAGLLVATAGVSATYIIIGTVCVSVALAAIVFLCRLGAFQEGD